MKTPFALALALLFQTVSAAAPPAKAGADVLAILARGSWPYAKADPDGPRAARGWIIRTENEFLEAAGFPRSATVTPKSVVAALAKKLKIEAIDFSQHTLIVISGGVKNSGGHRLEIVRVEKGGKGGVVHWLAEPPRGFATQAFTHPSEVVVIPKLDGDIRFEPAFGAAKNPPLKPSPRPAPKPRIKIN